MTDCPPPTPLRVGLPRDPKQAQQAMVAMDRTAALIAAGALHPQQDVREDARAAIGAAVGEASLRESVDRLSESVPRLAADLLEPIVLEESDVWAIAAIQLFREWTREVEMTPCMRVSGPDALDVAGGVDLYGVDHAIRSPRRDRTGCWNYPMGAAFHPTLLREWIRTATAHPQCRVGSATRDGAAILEVPVWHCGYETLVETMTAVESSPEPAWFKRWMCGGHVRSEPRGALRTQEDDEDQALQEVAESCLQHRSVVEPGAKSPGQIGMVVRVTSRHIECRFKTPEAVMRLSAMASQRGYISLNAIRRLGWIVLGRGEDDLRFVRAVHAFPPRWLQVKVLPEVEMPGTLRDTLARWVGAAASDVSVDVLESLI